MVNQKFTVSDGSTTTTDKLSITGGVTIPNIKVGNVVSIRGTVTSASSNLKSVTVGVYDSNNKLVTGKTVAPHAKTYNVRNLDAYVDFGSLKAGTYYYKVFATNATTTNFPVVEQKFTVSANGGTTSADTLSITGGTTVPNIKVGKAVSIRGTVKSGTSNITSLTVGVFTSSGNLVTGKTVRPNAKSYDIHQVDAYVNFNLLSPDTYYYGVVATNSSYQNQIVSYQKFTVTK